MGHDTRDERSLFSLTFHALSRAGYFEIYDIAQDSVIFRHRLTTYFGWMNILRDGSIAAYSESRKYIYPEEPLSPLTVTIFDITTMSMRVIIPTYGVDPNFPDGLSVDRFVLTPDGKWLIGSGFGLMGDDFGISIIDMENFKLHKIIQIFGNRVLKAVTCRQIPK